MSNTRIPTWIYALSTLLLFAWLSRQQTQAADTPTNVIFILTDDLGINDLHCYGRKDHHTPNLDRMATMGTRVTSAYAACPVCSPTRAAVLTGKHPARLHITTFLPGRADMPSQKLLHPKIPMQLPLAEVTLAERLKAVGYHTACFGKWHLGGPQFSPQKQGFDIYDAGRPNTPASANEGGKGEYDLTRKAIEFVRENRDRPFFLHLCHNTPHIPLGAKAELIAKNREAFNPLYAAVIESMDDTVGMLLKELDALKLSDRTLVIFTSDNGGLHVPELKEDTVTHNTPFRAGKGFVYEGGVRVPLIVRGPGIPAGRVVDAPMISTDWVPTLLEMLGRPVAEGLDGESMAKVLKGGDPTPRTLYWHIPHYTNQGSQPSGAMRDGPWKWVRHYENNRTELYDLRNDPSEEHDLSKQESQRTAGMATRFEAWLNAVHAQRNTPNPAFNADRHKQLYIDVDVSKLKAGANAIETAKPLREWRKRMDAKQ